VAQAVARSWSAPTGPGDTDLLGSRHASRPDRSEAELRDLAAANTCSTRGTADHRRGSGGGSLVREVMMPRTEVVFLSGGSPSPRRRLVRAETHTRYPVVDGTHDDVVGFVHLRDVLLRPDLDPCTTVGELTREVKQLPGSKRVLAALSEMRRERHHLAVVVDEYGGTAGIVTLEDLIEADRGSPRRVRAAPEPVHWTAGWSTAGCNLADSPSDRVVLPAGRTDDRRP
jgi:putative hemolysin